jgi:membrane protein YqaA with SNARE-associated domain
MLVAVGMYLPFDTSSAIFVGGLIKWIVDRISEKRAADEKLQIEEKGTLLASGLIAGEAIVGILLAVVFLAGMPAIATFKFFPAWGGWLSLIGFAAIAYVLIRIPVGQVSDLPASNSRR